RPMVATARAGLNPAICRDGRRNAGPAAIAPAKRLLGQVLMAKRIIDDIDRLLISLLSANARQPAALLARRLGLSRSAVQERLKRLERDGVIAGYTVTLGAEAPKAGVSAQVMLTLDPKFQDRAVDALRGL